MCIRDKDNILKRIIRTEYDTANRPEMTLVQDSGTGSLIYRAAVSYDSHEHISSQRERVSGANYTTSYSYDWDDRATDIQYGDATHRVRYGYDGQGRLQTRRVTNGSADQTATYSYLESSVAIPGLSTVSSTNLVSGISQPLVSFAYGYAGNTDNIVSETRTGGSYAGRTTYEYDSLGQLTRVNDPVAVSYTHLDVYKRQGLSAQPGGFPVQGRSFGLYLCDDDLQRRAGGQLYSGRAVSAFEKFAYGADSAAGCRAL